MILEGLVTTVGPQGRVNIAPMGPKVEPDMRRVVLRPFRSSTTYQNLKGHGEGVLHVTDDVWLLARAAIGPVDPPPELFSARVVAGQVLAGCCRWYEFRVASLDDREDRTSIACDIVYTGHVRDFFGFNRAKHAVVEAAILATRTDFLPLAEIQADFKKLAPLVEKTGGEAERRAFQFLEDHVTRIARERATHQ